MSESPSGPRLWLARHARPLVETGVCYGRLDVAADHAHTLSSAEQLHAALPPDIAQWRSSPLLRCEQLANALADLRSSLPTRLSDARLVEMNFGLWEGQRWDDVPRDELDAWTDDFVGYSPGDGESLQAMLTRVQQALTESRAIALREQKDVLWVTHAGVIRCVLWLVEHGKQLPSAKDWNAPAPGFGGWIALPLSER